MKQGPTADELETPQRLTLKTRCAEFWRWFSENAERFHATIEDKRCSDLQPEVSAAVDEWLPGMAWVFGPGPGKKGHSFTLSGEGQLAKQFIAEYWLNVAPELAGWTFYGSRQPTENDPGEFSIELANPKESFKPIEFWASPHVNEDREKIDLTVWHPSIDRLPENTRFMALFLILDELLGEHGTGNWIGKIHFSADRLRDALPISEMPELIRQTGAEREWRKNPPTEEYSSYRLKEPTDEYPRGDTLAGTTRFFDLIGDFLENHGPCEHPTPGLGVEHVYVAIEREFFPKGREADSRGEIEDAIQQRLEETHGGICLGGASGLNHCYCDFSLYDGQASLETILAVLRELKVPSTTQVLPFTADNGLRL